MHWLLYTLLTFACISEIHCEENNGILLIGGQTHAGKDTDIEYFTPTTIPPSSRILDHCKLKTARISAVSAALNRYESIIIGGLANDGGETNAKPLSSSEIINIKTEKVSDGPPMTTPRSRAAATVYNGQIWVCGGFDGNNVLKTCETLKQDDSNRKWKKAKSMNHARERAMLVTYGHNLYSIGGKNDKEGVVLSVEKYNSATKEWKHALDIEPDHGMQPGRVDAQAAVLGKNIFVCGGEGINGQPHQSCIWIFDDKFYPNAPNMKSKRSRFAMVAYDESLYAFGGQNVVDEPKNITATIEEYHPETLAWKITANMSTARADMSAVPVSPAMVPTTTRTNPVTTTTHTTTPVTTTTTDAATTTSTKVKTTTAHGGGTDVVCQWMPIALCFILYHSLFSIFQF